MEEIVNVISNVGFPIVCCVVMFNNNNKFTETIGNLNVTLKEISTRMDSLEDKINK